MEREENPILSVDFKHQYDSLADGVSYQARACIDMEAIQDGLIKKVGANKLPLLLVILSHMDKDGKAFPSQRKLAELSGQSVNTVNKLINDLLEIEINGQRILRRELVGTGSRKRSMYYIHQGRVTGTDAVDIVEKKTAQEQKDAETKQMNSRDIANYFNDVYTDTFGQGYTFNYGRDLGMIKKKLIPAYDDETIKGVIDVAVRQYKGRWANENYPLPTVAMLCTWLANQAFAIYQQDQEKAQKHEERKVKAVEQDDTERAMDLFDI